MMLPEANLTNLTLQMSNKRSLYHKYIDRIGAPQAKFVCVIFFIENEDEFEVMLW